MPPVTKPLALGGHNAFNTGQELILFENLDANIDAPFTITEAWFENGLPRKDVMFFVGYNFNAAEGRRDQTEPALGFQIESYDVAGDLVTPIVAAHLTLVTTGDVIMRPWSCSIVRATNESDLSFQNRNFIVDDQNNHLLLHATYGSSAQVGIATVANGNANLHVKGKELWESPSGTANNKFWDVDYSAGDSWIFRAVNDAYSAAGNVYTINRAGTTVQAIYFFPPIGVGGNGDAFFSRTGAKTIALDSSSVGVTFDVTLKLGILDIRGVTGAAASLGTLTTAPHAGNPDNWIPVSFNGVVHWVPGWHA